MRLEPFKSARALPQTKVDITDKGRVTGSRLRCLSLQSHHPIRCYLCG